MHRALFLSVFLLIWLILERKGFKERTHKKFRSTWIYLEKNRSPNVKWSLLHFATINILFFSVWEFVIRWALTPEPRFFSASLIAGLVGWTIFLILRGPAFKSPDFSASTGKVSGRFLWLLWILSSQLLLRSWLSVCLLPWAYYRSKFLAPRPSAAGIS